MPGLKTFLYLKKSFGQRFFEKKNTNNLCKNPKIDVGVKNKQKYSL